MTVVFYISGHGFGHASRQVEVINAFSARCPSARVLIRSAVNASLLERTLRVPFELRPGACDTGIVQRTSVEHDDEATVREAVAFYRDYSARADQEAKAFAGAGVRLVVGDIPPLAFEVADQLRVPSIAIGNFTWDWIYETHPGLADAAPWLVPQIRASYRKATLALELPFGGGFETFARRSKLPLLARRPGHSRVDTRGFFKVPTGRPALLLSFGGYGIPSLDLSRIDCDDWTVVLTDRILPSQPVAPNQRLIYIPEERFRDSEYRYEDLVAAVDVVASKPGYGIVSECIACRTPLLYTSRGEFREYDLFVREMPRYLRCRFISQQDLFAGRWHAALEALLEQPAPQETLDTNGAEVAADEILRLLRA